MSSSYHLPFLLALIQTSWQKLEYASKTTRRKIMWKMEEQQANRNLDPKMVESSSKPGLFTLGLLFVRKIFHPL